LKETKKGILQSYAMLVPNLILFVLISIYPILWALRYMFYEYDGFRPQKFIGLENFIRLFTRDENFWLSVQNTFTYAGAKILFIIPLAFLVAVLINNPKRLYGGIQAIIFSPTIMSAAVMSLVFYLLFNVYSGEINRFLMALGIVKEPINWLGAQFAMATVVIVAVWGGIGNYMVYFLAGLQQIPTEMYESAEIDGATAWQRMSRITVPMLGPVLKIILMLAIISAFNDMQSIMILTEGGPFNRTNVMFLYIYKLYYPTSSTAGGAFLAQYGYGAAASIVAAGIVAIVTGIYLHASKKLDEIY
jgi:raffinose/stachyose/melibiose transport system permease protein